MDTAKKIKELRENINMSRKEFSEYIGIPIRTLENWEAARRTPPEYILRLISYQIKFKTVNQKTYDTNRNVSVIKDTDGNSIVVINDKIFKEQDKKDWKEVEK